MQAYVPQSLLIETAVAEAPVTRRIRELFPKVPTQWVASVLDWKEPGPITPAKRILAIAEQKGEALKPFPKIRHAINLGDYVFNPISNCHLECTYCILQSYLKNNPVLTVFANTGHFIEKIRGLSAANPGRTFRLGTGELSDSLALDDLTGFSAEWIPFFAEQENLYLELKTKSDRIDRLLELEPRGHTVISWSLAPENIVAREELKCASLAQRLEGAHRVQAAGYPVGLHLDPLIWHSDWQSSYDNLLDRVSRTLDPRRIAWVSVGSLRYDKALKDIATERFPQTAIFSQDFVTAPDGKLRYFKTLRREMYRHVWQRLQEWSEAFPRYLCMEPPWMWEEVTGTPAPDPTTIEAALIARLKGFSAS